MTSCNRNGKCFLFVALVRCLIGKSESGAIEQLVVGSTRQLTINIALRLPYYTDVNHYLTRIGARVLNYPIQRPGFNLYFFFSWTLEKKKKFFYREIEPACPVKIYVTQIISVRFVGSVVSRGEFPWAVSIMSLLFYRLSVQTRAGGTSVLRLLGFFDHSVFAVIRYFQLFDII